MTSHPQTIDIAAVVCNAVVFNMNRWGDGPLDANSIYESVGRLFRLLNERRIDYVLVGGIALLKYVAGRNTEDIDLIVAVESLATLPEIDLTDQNEYFGRGTFGDLRIDLLFTRNRLFDRVRRQFTTRTTFVQATIPCATVAGLLLLKLYALPALYRQGDFTRVNLYESDIAALLQSHRPPLEPLWAELASHLSGPELDAVRQIVREIEARVARFGQRFPGDAQG